MQNRNRAARLPRIKLISVAVASCFASHLAFANPTAPAVVNGQVTFSQQGNPLTHTWQSRGTKTVSWTVQPTKGPSQSGVCQLEVS